MEKEKPRAGNVCIVAHFRTKRVYYLSLDGVRSRRQATFDWMRIAQGWLVDLVDADSISRDCKLLVV